MDFLNENSHRSKDIFFLFNLFLFLFSAQRSGAAVRYYFTSKRVADISFYRVHKRVTAEFE